MSRRSAGLLFAAAILTAVVAGVSLRDTMGYAVRQPDGSFMGDLTHYVYWTRLVTLGGLVASAIALVVMAGWTPASPLDQVALALGVFGLGFGLTVTPRSTAAVEAVGRHAFGVASATVTVARMIGMAVGLAVLTAYGSTTIDRLYDQVYATPEAYKAFIPADLRDRPLRDGLVVQALETWAAGEAARIMVGIFLVASGLTVAAVPAALAMGGSRLPEAIGRSAERGEELDGADETEPTLAL